MARRACFTGSSGNACRAGRMGSILSFRKARRIVTRPRAKRAKNGLKLAVARCMVFAGPRYKCSTAPRYALTQAETARRALFRARAGIRSSGSAAALYRHEKARRARWSSGQKKSPATGAGVCLFAVFAAIVKNQKRHE